MPIEPGQPMAILKQNLTKAADWQLVYDTRRKELYVEAKGEGRLSIDAALKLKGDGPAALNIAIIDMFDGPRKEDRDSQRLS
jgi:hypothetical protein